MDTTKTVYLHIGWQKTGTSSIQSFLHRNNDWLRDRGILYPVLDARVHHVKVYDALMSASPRRIERLTEELRDLVKRSDEEAVVLSHETLYACNPVMFRSIFDDCDVRVIAYLRRPDLSAISSFVTRIRYGTLACTNFQRAARQFSRNIVKFLDYYWPLKNFANVFGRESLILRPYETSRLYGESSVSDFMHLLGHDDLTGTKWPDARSNPSLDVDQLAFVLEIVQQLADLQPSRVKQLTRETCEILLDQTGSDPTRNVSRFVSARAKRNMLRYLSPNLQLLIDDLLDGKTIFPSESEGPTPYDGLSNEKRVHYRDALIEDDRLPYRIRRILTSSVESVTMPMQRSVAPVNGHTSDARTSSQPEVESFAARIELPAHRTVYLHIGTPKTGTTAIQKYFFDSGEQLAEQGVSYPQDDRFFWHWAHHPLAAVLSEPYAAWVDRRYDIEPSVMYNALREWIDACESPNIVLSSEQFSLAKNLSRVPELLGGLDLKVICYFRWQPDFLQSWFKQAIVTGGRFYQLTPEDVVRHIRVWEGELDYYDKAEQFSEWFGRENVIIRIFDRQHLHEGDLICDFLHVLGVDASTLPSREGLESVNRSCSGDLLEFKAFTNSPDLWSNELPSMQRFSREIQPLLHQFSGDTPYSASLARCYPMEMRQAILDRFAESNRLLVEEYLNGSVRVPETVAPDDAERTEIDLARFAGLVVELWKFKEMQSKGLQQRLDRINNELQVQLKE